MSIIKSPTQIREEQAQSLIALLNDLKTKIDEDKVNLKNLILQLNGLLERFYDPQNTHLSTADKLKKNILFLEKKKCDSISFDPICNVHNIAEDMKSLIDTIVVEIKALGIPIRTTVSDKSVNVNNNITQNQSQEQTQGVYLLANLLKNSLAPYQLEELKQVAKADIPTTEKRKSLMDKILSFGSNVGASVLANILTNPTIYSIL